MWDLFSFSWRSFFSNAASLAVLPAFVWYMNQFQIEPEEAALRDKFERRSTITA